MLQFQLFDSEQREVGTTLTIDPRVLMVLGFFAPIVTSKVSNCLYKYNIVDFIIVP